MTVQYASDLHLELAINDAYMEKYPLEKKGDVLLLAGDVINLKDDDFNKRHFDLWEDTFDRVLIVPGNHEFYGKHYPIEKTFPSFLKPVRDNILYLNNRVEIIDNHRFIFSTLFSEVSPEQAVLVKRYLNDFHISRYGNDSNLSLTINEYNRCHIKCRVFLEEELSRSFVGKTIVVSHHVPYDKSFIEGYPKFRFDLSDAFHVDLTWLVKKYEVDHWISGHTHFNHRSIEIEGTMFHTNQLGYIEAQEHKSFDRHATIRL